MVMFWRAGAPSEGRVGRRDGGYWVGRVVFRAGVETMSGGHEVGERCGTYLG